MRAKVTEQGVTVPKEFFSTASEVEICRENGTVVLRPVEVRDPLAGLGAKPVACGLEDGSENHDRYLTSDAQ